MSNNSLDSLRTGYITATSVFLGFALALLQIWSFGPDKWIIWDSIPAILIFSGMFILMNSLFSLLGRNDFENSKYIDKIRKRIRLGFILLFTSVIIIHFISYVAKRDTLTEYEIINKCNPKERYKIERTTQKPSNCSVQKK